MSALGQLQQVLHGHCFPHNAYQSFKTSEVLGI